MAMAAPISTAAKQVFSWHGDYDYIDWTAIEAISVLRKSGAKETIN